MAVLRYTLGVSIAERSQGQDPRVTYRPFPRRSINSDRKMDMWDALHIGTQVEYRGGCAEITVKVAAVAAAGLYVVFWHAAHRSTEPKIQHLP
jgi:hypothetical protein